MGPDLGSQDFRGISRCRDSGPFEAAAATRSALPPGRVMPSLDQLGAFPDSSFGWRALAKGRLELPQVAYGKRDLALGLSAKMAGQGESCVPVDGHLRAGDGQKRLIRSPVSSNTITRTVSPPLVRP
jgi:hypothetical protein